MPVRRARRSGAHRHCQLHAPRRKQEHTAPPTFAIDSNNHKLIELRQQTHALQVKRDEAADKLDLAMQQLEQQRMQREDEMSRQREAIDLSTPISKALQQIVEDVSDEEEALRLISSLCDELDVVM